MIKGLKVIAAAAAMLCVQSCATTEHITSVGGCAGAFAKDARLLITEGEGMPQQLSYELYQQAKEQMVEKGLKPDYAVEQDLELRVRGILPHTPMDSLQLEKLQQLGYNYVLQVNLLGQQEARGSGYVSSSERKVYGDSYELKRDLTKVSLQFLLYDTRSQKQIYTLNTVTEVKPYTRTDSEGGEDRTNFSSVEMAMRKAIRKGTERLLEDCHCCQ